jgi:polysaccharide pyruvyl transferase WcaK-like protein
MLLRKKHEVKILHVASFLGNIGDNANHLGFYAKLESKIGQFSITKFEIRSTFRGTSSFGLEFAELCNQHDAVVFGGGNFFELWVEKSATGCSIDIAPEVIDEIKVPMIFNALGVDVGQGITTSTIANFRSFLSHLLKRGDTILSCRNDGAFDNLQQYVGVEYSQYFSRIPDAGFFFKPSLLKHAELDQKKQNILFQLAGDMLETRFSQEPGSLSYSDYLMEMALTINDLGQENHIIFCAHIFSDLKPVSDLLQLVDDKVRRENVSVAPYLQGTTGARHIFSLYSQTNLNIATRFHANVCSLAAGQATIGLVNYRQIKDLYSEIKSDNYVDIRKVGFSNHLTSLSRELLAENGPPACDIDTDSYDKFINEIAALIV